MGCDWGPLNRLATLACRSSKLSTPPSDLIKTQASHTSRISRTKPGLEPLCLSQRTNHLYRLRPRISLPPPPLNLILDQIRIISSTNSKDYNSLPTSSILPQTSSSFPTNPDSVIPVGSLFHHPLLQQQSIYTYSRMPTNYKCYNN